MALAVKQPGSYIAKNVYRLSDDIDVARFKDAWVKTVELCGNLRTRIVLREGVMFQAIVKEDITWEHTDGLDVSAFMRAVKDVKMQHGSRLYRHALIDSQHGEKYFILIVHHAVFDGWSFNVILDTLFRAYRQTDLPAPQPYSDFINYVINLDQVEAGEYWKAQLDGAHRARSHPQITKLAHPL